MSEIKVVILWTNENVMVLDEDGKQMPEYQGHFPEIKKLILDVTKDKDGVMFFVGKRKEGLFNMTREDFIRTQPKATIRSH